MIVKLDTKTLETRLKQLQAVVDSRATISAYSHVLLTVAGGVATFRANNPTIGMFESSAKSEGDDGTLLLPSKRLGEIVPNLEAAKSPVTTFETDGTTDGEGNSTVTIKCGKYKAALRARPANEFPAVFDRPTEVITTLGLPGFLALIEKVAFSVPESNGKYTVAVALLDFKADEIRLVGTDGFRLTVASQVGTVRTPIGEIPTALSIPKTALNLLHLLTGTTFTLSETENALFFQTDTETLAALKVSGQFPPYERVFPTATPVTTITLNRDALAFAIGRAKPVADDELPNIVFSLTPTGTEVTPLIIHSTSKAAGMANDAIDVKAQGAPQELTFNAAFLMPFIDHAGPEITIRIIAPGVPTEFNCGPTYRFFLAPAVVS